MHKISAVWLVSSRQGWENVQEVKVDLLQALKTSRPLNATTIVEIKLNSDMPELLIKQKTEWNKVRGETRT